MSDPQRPELPSGGQEPWSFPPPPDASAYPGYERPPESPSGTPAIIAGILALLGGVAHGFLAFKTNGGSASVMAAGVLLLNAVLAMLLLPGGVLLLMRRKLGRWLVACGSVIAALYFVAVGVYLAVLADALTDGRAGGTSIGAALSVDVVTVFVMCLPALATFVLTVLPLTGRWIRDVRPS